MNDEDITVAVVLNLRIEIGFDNLIPFYDKHIF
jgi:hypothetical protein